MPGERRGGMPHPRRALEEVIPAIRRECGPSVRHVSTTLEERADVFALKADMISVISPTDRPSRGRPTSSTKGNWPPTRACALRRGAGSRYGTPAPLEPPPHRTGCSRALRHLFFGWPGGTWSPATIENTSTARADAGRCACTVAWAGQAVLAP